MRHQNGHKKLPKTKAVDAHVWRPVCIVRNCVDTFNATMAGTTLSKMSMTKLPMMKTLNFKLVWICILSLFCFSSDTYVLFKMAIKFKIHNQITRFTRIKLHKRLPVFHIPTGSTPFSYILNLLLHCYQILYDGVFL